MTDITKRRLSIVVAVLIVLIGLAGRSYLSQQKQAPPREEVKQDIVAVKTQLITNQAIPTSIDIQGQLQAYNKVDIFTEVVGTLKHTGRPLKVGTYYPKGSLLIKVDDTEASLGLQAQKSTLLNAIAQMLPDLKIDYPQSFPQWESYLKAFDINASTPPLPSATSDREKLFVAIRNIQTQYFNIKSAEERLGKYRIYAPFGGVLTEVMTNEGAVVRAGQQLGQLVATGEYELVVTIQLSELQTIQVGNKVQLKSDDILGKWQGTVKRINDRIDPASQTIQVFIGVNGKDIREGMYLSGEIATQQADDAVEVDRNLLFDTNKIYIVVDNKLQAVEVSIIKLKRNTALLRGLTNGSRLLTQPVAGAYSGMPVQVTQ